MKALAGATVAVAMVIGGSAAAATPAYDVTVKNVGCTKDHAQVRRVSVTAESGLGVRFEVMRDGVMVRSTGGTKSVPRSRTQNLLGVRVKPGHTKVVRVVVYGFHPDREVDTLAVRMTSHC